jgi:hypothetical protein
VSDTPLPQQQGSSIVAGLEAANIPKAGVCVCVCTRVHALRGVSLSLEMVWPRLNVSSFHFVFGDSQDGHFVFHYVLRVTIELNFSKLFYP